MVAVSEVLQQVTAPRAVAAATGNTHLAAFEVLSQDSEAAAAATAAADEAEAGKYQLEILKSQL